MATRVKADKQPLINISDWSKADQLIKEIGEIDGTITAANNNATVEINKIKSDLDVNVKQLQARQKCIVESLEEFALAHTKDFGEAKSRKLDFGTLGWRFSTWIEVAGTTLERIKEFFTKEEQKLCIRVGKETVNKEGLEKLRDERLLLVKARRKTKDAFFVEPLLTEAADKT